MNETSNKNESEGEGLGSAYHRMLERVRTAFELTGESGALPALQEKIEDAKEKAVELDELTRDEAEKIGEYLRRDLHDAAGFMADTGKELRDWLSFDLELIEARLAKVFALMVDQTRLELDRLAERARESEALHTGEVTAMGTLRCTGCGKEMQFKKPGHIPPCPKCHGTRFSRVAG